jgi:hypothetical protein
VAETPESLEATSTLPPAGYAFDGVGFRLNALDDQGSQIVAFVEPATVLVPTPADSESRVAIRTNWRGPLGTLSSWPEWSCQPG